jgi:3-oxoacyl-[acyl-carrier protein] reductase
VLVTGASRGIGRAIVMELVRQGVQPVLTATSQAVLDELADTIASETGRRPLAVAADLTEETAIANLADAVARVHGRLDGLVNNAGVTFSGKIEQTPTEAWDRCMVTNARGPFILCRRCLPMLRKAEDPCIINISSVVGVKGYANQTAYTASKHALRGFSIALVLTPTLRRAGPKNP